jgi:high-affinity K+ transport system ATPase subunit B
LLVTSRNKLIAQKVPGADPLPPVAGGLECVVMIDQRYAAALRFRDAPRAESRSFVRHLGPKHHFARVMIISGDRESEVQYLAEQVGITEVHAQKSPEKNSRSSARKPPPPKRSTWVTASMTPRP